MKLIAFEAGGRTKKRQYAIVDDDGGRLATLNSLEKASVLYRFLNGLDATPGESEQALEIMREMETAQAD